MSDVIGVLQSCQNQLIFFGVVLALAIIVMVAVMKLPKATKRLIRGEAGIAIVLALVITANLICTGPMRTLLDSASSGGSISQGTSEEATQLCTEIAKEGIVLLENDGALPLVSGDKLNVFGWGSTNPCYGGTGSGALNDGYPTVSLLEGLENAGLNTNSALSDFYTGYCAERPTGSMFEANWTLPEPNVSQYADDLISSAKEFSDTAMVVITRIGGEGADLPRDMVNEPLYDDSLNEGNDWDSGDHYLQLSNREEEMLDLVCDNFDRVILIYNGANPFQLGFVEDYPQIKSVLWCAGVGQSGFNALGSILTGEVNPSGRTVDTFVYDLTTTPTWNNFGDFTYEDIFTNDTGRAQLAAASPTFVNYVEGIYVGYRFYETASAENLIDYDKTVQYPFGYGLSYTTFTQEMGAISESGGAISFDVTVTNTGSAAGKDVVEVYYNPPYTNGGIEKASANLVAFAKTGVIEPGKSETVTISIDLEDMASFDAHGAGAYVLESGEYIISINSDSHNVLDSQTYTVNSTVTYGASNQRSTDKIAAVSQFQFAEGDITYLSRADGFANYDSATAAPASYAMSEDAKAGFLWTGNYDPASQDDPNAEAPAMGQDNGLQLVDLRGVDYDDEKWDLLLDELTAADMNALISLGGYQTSAVDSIGKLRTNDCDGPASINNNFTQQGSIGFPAAVVIAATWNTDLAEEFGDSIGVMANEMDVSGWYAPAMNIHRNAFAGRTFEYYSEDGLLSGKMAASAIIGAEAHGVYSYMKHFALNDQETHRNDMLCTWSTEQAIREIYLKPFELSVKEGGADAVMSAFNYVGNRWAGACSELLNTVLRDEWGFKGFVLTDYFGCYNHMKPRMKATSEDMKQFIEMCFDPASPYNGKLKDTLFKMMEESRQ